MNFHMLNVAASIFTGGLIVNHIWANQNRQNSIDAMMEVVRHTREDLARLNSRLDAFTNRTQNIDDLREAS